MNKAKKLGLWGTIVAVLIGVGSLFVPDPNVRKVMQDHAEDVGAVADRAAEAVAGGDEKPQAPAEAPAPDR